MNDVITGPEIKRRLRELGKSQAALARHLGIDPSAVSKMVSGVRQPQAREIVPLYEFLELPLPDSIRAFDSRSWPVDLPVRGCAAGAFQGSFVLSEDTIDFVRRPPALAHTRDAFALYVRGTSMQPKFEPGDLVFIHPGRAPRVGDYVVAILRHHDADLPQAYIKRLARIADDHIVLEQFNPEATQRIDRRIVMALYRVMTVNDMFGA